MIKAIIFDLFGVLTTDALSVIVADLKTTDNDKAEYIVKLITATNKGLIEPEISRPAIAATLGLTPKEYAKRIKDGETKNHQLLEYIIKLRSSYKTALLSNVSNKSSIDVRFSKEEFTTHFDVVVASGDIGFAKPEARAYEITADKLGVRLDECIMIDDREEYCDGATSVGMQAIKYKSFEQFKYDYNNLIKSLKKNS